MCRKYKEEYKEYWEYVIEHMLNLAVNGSSFQEIEQYLWNDVEMKDPMINITNDDRIVGHGFDLKSSFRKEKKNAWIMERDFEKSISW